MIVIGVQLGCGIIVLLFFVSSSSSLMKIPYKETLLWE